MILNYKIATMYVISIFLSSAKIRLRSPTLGGYVVSLMLSISTRTQRFRSAAMCSLTKQEPTEVFLTTLWFYQIGTHFQHRYLFEPPWAHVNLVPLFRPSLYII
jgi:hypothetical protein